MSTTVMLSRTPAEDRGGEPCVLTADDYLRMIDAGVIPDARRVELWEGQLVRKMGKNQPHIIAQGLLDDALGVVVAAGWHVVVEGSLRLSAHHVPQPDIMVLRGARKDYLRRVPTPGDVGLVVEVADSSVPKDLVRMQAAYAAGGVPAYWVLNLPAAQVEAFTVRKGGKRPRYGRHDTYGPCDVIPLVLGDLPVAELAVADLLPAE